MGEAGLFDEDARVELLEGEVTKMAPIGARHFASVTRLGRLLQARVAERAIVSIQSPVVLDDHSEPQPDVALLSPRSDDYESGLPGPGDVLLVVEVADTSLARDRDVKAPLYARAGISEAWIVDLAGAAILVLRGPSPTGYRDSHRAERGDALEPQALPGLVIAVVDILGKVGL